MYTTTGEEELGWKASQHDYDSYIKGYGKDGKFKGLFLVDTDSRETIGSALCAVVDVGKNDKLMSIGWYYMKKELRGKGIGTELFNKLIEEEKRKKTNMCLTSGKSKAEIPTRS
uniref:N-acetyltransferase domain-containing protein n=1 Tax=Steinernema glaseri TaxID=37863 RepID=A0A1I7YYT9_9BILA